MIDSQHYARERAVMSPVMRELGLQDGEYILVTLHRPSNVDVVDQLGGRALATLSKTRTVIFPAHPRTVARIKDFGLDAILDTHPKLRIIGPQGYVKFLRLVMGASFVITDSGGLQEETTALQLPCLTVRTTTERPITCEIGTNQLVRPTGSALIEAAAPLLDGERTTGSIPLFWDGRAGQRIARRVMKILYPEMVLSKSDQREGERIE